MLEMLERATAALLLLNSLKADCWLLTCANITFLIIIPMLILYMIPDPDPDPDADPNAYRLLESKDLILPLLNGFLLLDPSLLKKLLVSEKQNLSLFKLQCVDWNQSEKAFVDLYSEFL